MAGNSGVFESTQAPSIVAYLHQLAGATAKYVFVPVVRMKIAALQYSSDSGSSGTDKCTPTLVNDTTSDTIITGTTLTANDAPTTVTAVDSGKSAILLPGHTYSINLSYAGTAANVVRFSIALWAYPAPHLAS